MTSPPRLLIVGNDRDLRTMLEITFAYDGNGYQVYSAPSGNSALLQFGIVQPDLIILDIASPEGGWDTLHRIRELSSVPIIVLSPEDRPEISIRSMERGADYCMILPVSMHELRVRLRALLPRESRLEESSHRGAQRSSA